MNEMICRSCKHWGYFNGKPMDNTGHSKCLEDLEEQGRLVELPAENNFKRDERDRCIHRHCNKCDGYRKEIQRYKDLEKQGRLVVLPKGFNLKVFKETVAERYCPRFFGLNDVGCEGGKSIKISDCLECWEHEMKGE